MKTSLQKFSFVMFTMMLLLMPDISLAKRHASKKTIFERSQQNTQCGFKNPKACKNKMFEGVQTTIVEKERLDKDVTQSACIGWCGDPNYRLSYDPRGKENTYSDERIREPSAGVNGLLWRLEWK